MSLRDRIGIDVGRRLRLEEALEWAAEHEVRWIDIQLDAGSNALSSFDDARAAGVRRACERYGVHLGLHTASAAMSQKWRPTLAMPSSVISRPMSRSRHDLAPNGSACMRACISPLN